MDLKTAEDILMPIGKYRNKKIKDIALFDRDYLIWFYQNAHSFKNYDKVIQAVGTILYKRTRAKTTYFKL